MVSLAMYPSIESFSLIFPEWKTDAHPRTSVPWYKSLALSTGHQILGYGEQDGLPGHAEEAEQAALGQTDLQHSWPSHPMLSLSLTFWGNFSPTPQAHQVWRMPNHQLHCEGAVHSMRVYLCLGDAGYQGGSPTAVVLLVSYSYKFLMLRAWDGSLCSSWTLSLYCLQTVKLTRHVHLRLLSISAVSFLNQLEKNTLKIILKCSVRSSVEYLRTFLTEAYFNTIFTSDFPTYLMPTEFTAGLSHSSTYPTAHLAVMYIKQHHVVSPCLGEAEAASTAWQTGFAACS